MQRQFSCCWLALPQITEIASLINVWFLLLWIISENASISSVIMNLTHPILVFLSVMQDQRESSFFDALKHNYGKSPNESKLYMLIFHGDLIVTLLSL